MSTLALVRCHVRDCKHYGPIFRCEYGQCRKGSIDIDNVLQTEKHETGQIRQTLIYIAQRTCVQYESKSVDNTKI